MALQKLRSDATGITYALPSDPDYVVRFKNSSQVKSLSGLSVQNNVTEIIINDLNNVTAGTLSVPEALSVRLKVSGSSLNSARKKAILIALAAQIEDWADEHVFEGFEPQTPPVEPV